MKSLNHILVIALVSLAGVLVSCVNKEYPLTQNYTVTENRTENITESYTENETYMSISSGEFELPSFNSWTSFDISLNGSGNFYYYGYDVPDWGLTIISASKSRYGSTSIRVGKNYGLDMTKTGHISYPEPPLVGEEAATTNETSNYSITGTASNNWLKSANDALAQAKFLGAMTNLWSNLDNPQVIELNAGKAAKIAIIVSGPQNKWNTYPRLFVRWTASTPFSRPVVRERIIQNEVPYQVVKQRMYYQIKSVPFWETLFPTR